MAKTDRVILISNDQQFGQVANPDKLEAQITHAFDKIDENDTEFNNHKKTVDPTSSDTTRDKHVSNNDLKGLQDQITTNLNDLTNHKKQVDPTSSDTTRDKHVANNDLKTLQDQITTNDTASLNRDNAHKNASVLDHPDQSVTTEKLKDFAVTSNKIANGAVSRNQLDPSLFEQTANASKFQEIDAQLADNAKLFVVATNPPSSLTALKGDGVVDNTTSLQAMVDWVGQNGGGTIYVPKGDYYLSSKVVVKYNNVFIQGQNSISTRFLLEPNGKIYFWQNEGETFVATNPKYTAGNNLPPFADILYFDPVEYGGVDYRNQNVGISDVTFHKLSGSPFCLYFYKCDNVTIININVTFGNPTGTPVSGTDNAIKFYYCSNVQAENINIKDNFELIFGMFIYWSYGVTLNNISVGNVSSKGIELKHVVSLTGDNLRTKVNYNTNSIVGVAVGYGSHMVNLKNIYLNNCSLRLSSSVEYEYSTDIHVDNLVVEDFYAAIDLWHLKNFSIKNVRLIGTTKYADMYGFMNTIQPHYTFSDLESNDGLYTKNTSYFSFDHDYDYKELVNYGGVNHYRYYVYLQQPHLVNGEIKNITIELTKTNNVTNCNFRTFATQGTFPYVDLISNGKFKIKNGYLPISLKGVTLDNINVLFKGNANATKTIRHLFFSANLLSLQNCIIKNINLKAENVSAVNLNDNIPDIADNTFLSLAKLENCLIENIQLLPYAQYGDSHTYIRGYENLVLRKIVSKVTNLDGSYNPTTIKFISVLLADSTSAFYLSNEDYKNLLIDSIDIKGFKCLIFFNDGKVNIADTQLSGNRFINNTITNSAYNETTFIFMIDSGGSAVNQTPLKSLNTINNVLIP